MRVRDSDQFNQILVALYSESVLEKLFCNILVTLLSCRNKGH